MQHYVVVAKCYEINEAGDETLEDVNILMVEHSKDDALADIENLKKEYIDEDYCIRDEDFHNEDGGVLVIPNEENPGFYIHLYLEEVN